MGFSYPIPPNSRTWKVKKKRLFPYQSESRLISEELCVQSAFWWDKLKKNTAKSMEQLRLSRIVNEQTEEKYQNPVKGSSNKELMKRSNI